jgi:hypothetical protein
MKNNIKSSYQFLPINLLKLDEYQRRWELSDTAWVKEKSECFDPRLLGTITVSKRDGSYYVIDGQHRVMLCKAVKRDGIMALVYEGLTKIHEASYFKKLNGANGEIRKLKKTQIHSASVVAEEKMAVEIQQTAEKYGFVIESSKRNNTVAAISVVEKVYKKYGLQILDDTFSLLRATWNGDKKSLDAEVIEGVAGFISTYKTDAFYNPRTFVAKLQKIAPIVISREAFADTSASAKYARVINVLFKYYNHNNTSKTRLANKHYTLG